jgi:tetratricopeptide (TPR) repeat protein
MANEAARVCIDSGDFDAAQRLYKKGHDLGLKEPNISPGRKDVWEYRWEHAEARVAARRGNKAAADKHVTAAEAILRDLNQKDPKLYDQQKTFQPYLTGYVALYTGDPKAALADLQTANADDPFIQCLIGMAYEKLGDKDKATEMYRKAAGVRGHNPPAAFAHNFTRKKLAAS